MLPEDKADLISWYNTKNNIDAEKSKEETKKARRKKGSRLQAAEDSVIAANKKTLGS